MSSLVGLLTYFYLPPETSEAAFPVYLSTRTIFGVTIFGLVTYVSGLFPIIFNPIVSSLSDRSKSPLGRRRLFMIIGFLPVAVFSFLAFSPPVDGVSDANALYLFLVLIFLHLFRTVFGVSNALIPELGRTSKLMMLMNTFNSVGWIIGFIIGSEAVFVVKEALMHTGMNAVDAFRVTLGGLIAISALLNIAQILVIDEKRYCRGVSSNTPLFPALKKAITNRSFLLFVFTQQVYYWGDGFFQMGLVYFITILFGLPESMMLTFGAVLVALSLAFYPLVNMAATKVSKKKLFSFGLFVQAGVMAMIGFSSIIPISGSVLIWIIVFFSAIVSAVTGIVPGAISGEIIREDAVRTGDPKEASFNAAMGLLTAIPAGFTTLAFPSLLLLGKSTSNPAGVKLIAIVGGLCMIAAMVMLRFYNEKKIRASLEAHGYN